jgi:hypothetical protein
MVETINKSVGEGATTINRDVDVKKVAALLNKVEPKDGGPAPKLREGAFRSLDLIDAIRRFQLHQFAGATGRVDPGGPTMSMLNMYSFGKPSGPIVPRLFGLIYRSKTVGAAQTMVGATSNEPVDQKGNPIDPTQMYGSGPDKPIVERRGWQHLKEFFDLSGVHLPDKEFSTFEPGRGRAPGKIGWCGIFTIWSLIKAGHAVKYKLGVGICNEKNGQAGARVSLIKPQPGKISVATLGDVCVVNDRNDDAVTKENPQGILFHHVIVASEPDAAGNFDAIEGNFPNKAAVSQCIVDVTTSFGGRRNLGQILYYYDLYRPQWL